MAAAESTPTEAAEAAAAEAAAAEDQEPSTVDKTARRAVKTEREQKELKRSLREMPVSRGMASRILNSASKPTTGMTASKPTTGATLQPFILLSPFADVTLTTVSCLLGCSSDIRDESKLHKSRAVVWKAAVCLAGLCIPGPSVLHRLYLRPLCVTSTVSPAPLCYIDNVAECSYSCLLQLSALLIYPQRHSSDSSESILVGKQV